MDSHRKLVPRSEVIAAIKLSNMIQKPLIFMNNLEIGEVEEIKLKIL
jgi:hypothetical protein